jgi:hypothetical protein
MSKTVKRSWRDEQPDTYRVQRLKRKPASDWQARVSQVFGGGMVGMSGDGWKFCQQVFDFDYMGAAEYEFGAIPKALKNIVDERADYRAWSFVIKSADIKPGWWRQRGMDSYRRAEIREARERGEKPPRMSPRHKKELAEKAGAPIPDATVYVVSNSSQDRAVVEKLIRRVNRGEIHPKNGAGFDLDREPGGYGGDVIGWFDLDNELLWFTDKDVFDGFVAIFEIGGADVTA